MHTAAKNPETLQVKYYATYKLDNVEGTWNPTLDLPVSEIVEAVKSLAGKFSRGKEISSIEVLSGNVGTHVRKLGAYKRGVSYAFATEAVTNAPTSNWMNISRWNAQCLTFDNNRGRLLMGGYVHVFKTGMLVTVTTVQLADGNHPVILIRW